MDTGLESVCCREIGRIDALRGDGDDCITMHETFTGACLNIHALQIAYYAEIYAAIYPRHSAALAIPV